MGHCLDLFRNLLYVLNILFWIAGMGLVGLGAWLLADVTLKQMLELIGLDITGKVSVILLSLGSSMFLIGLFGCCGAMRESRFLLVTYLFLLSVLFFIQLIAGVWAVVARSSVNTSIRQQLNSTLPIDRDRETPVRTSLLIIQNNLQCCGLINGCQDWKSNITIGCTCERTGLDDPLCQVSRVCDVLKRTRRPIFMKNCFDAILAFVDSNFSLFAIGSIVLTIIESFLLVSAVVVCHNSGNEEFQSF